MKDAILTTALHLYATAKPVLHPLMELTLVSAVLVPLEVLFAVRRTKFFYNGLWADLSWYFFHMFTGALWMAPAMALLGWSIHSVLPLGLTAPIAALPIWARFPIALLLYECGLYWYHRWAHEIPLLWRFHAVHHSVTHLSFLAASRTHPIDIMLTRALGMAPLFALGLDTMSGPHAARISEVIVIGSSLSSYFIHSNIKWRLGPLEAVMATPFFHHWHHTKIDHIDHNYATFLPLMDWLFGTLYMPKEWPAEYGTQTPVPDSMPGQIIAPFVPNAPPATTPAPET